MHTLFIRRKQVLGKAQTRNGWSSFWIAGLEDFLSVRDAKSDRQRGSSLVSRFLVKSTPKNRFAGRVLILNSVLRFYEILAAVHRQV